MNSKDVKVRVWDKENNEWLYYTIERFLDDEHLGACIAIDRSKTGDFTGMHDKNGKEIYGGDIVIDGGHIEEVKWLKKIDSSWQPIGSSGYMLSNPKTLEVIGNVFQNPELLSDQHQRL